MTEERFVARQIGVVGAVVIRNGLVLCAKRGKDGSLPGLWEFPGGKIEKGELPSGALIREIKEELAVSIAVGDEIVTTTHEYEFGVVSLTTFYCSLLAGAPVPLEHAEIAWLRPADLMTVQWAPADIPAVHRVQADMA
jgi:8-oxo-dGTP diphosphatase